MKRKPTSPPPANIVLVQVVSVEISSDSPGVLYTEGLNFLKEEHFRSDTVATLKMKLSAEDEPKEVPSHIVAVATNEGKDQFMLLEYLSNLKNTYMPFKLIFYDRQHKHPVDVGNILFAPESRDGLLIFSGMGKNITNWEIATRPASPEVLAKAALFVGDRNVITFKEAEPPGDVSILEPAADGLSMAPLPKRELNRVLNRLRAKNGPFEDVLKEMKLKNPKVMEISTALTAYLKKKEQSVLSFMVDMDESDPHLFYNLLALQSIHPELQPLLDMSYEEAEKLGKHAMNIELGGLLAKIRLDQQQEVWDEICKLHKVYLKIRKLKEKAKQPLPV